MAVHTQHAGSAFALGWCLAEFGVDQLFYLKFLMPLYLTEALKFYPRPTPFADFLLVQHN